MNYKVSFIDIFEADSEENCYNHLLKYLSECVENKDVTAFNFIECESEDVN